MNIELGLTYLLGLCIGIPIGIYLKKIGYVFWKKKDANVLEGES